jgi:hypothetical protein
MTVNALPVREALLDRRQKLDAAIVTEGTDVCGRARASGDVEVCNAGHVLPLVVSGGDVQIIASGGLPLGMFCGERFSTTRLRLASDDAIVLQR